MMVISSPTRLTLAIKGLKRQNKTVGFVPTMGALHAGHISLIRRARKDNDSVIVSIFVNPAQFGPQEDFLRYPRPFKRDLLICRKEGVDIVFHPSPGQMYPRGFSTFVKVEGLSEVLCGESRPGHFQGVSTVVTKLLNIVQPDSAYFGQKDAQQAMIIKKMVCDLNIPVKIKVMPTIRQKGGLALSSRNAYLNPQERADALVLYDSLKLAKRLFKKGLKDTKKIILHMRDLIKKNKNAKIDYIAVVSPNDLMPIKKISGQSLLVLAVRIGKVRLIDNIILCGKSK